MSFTPTSSEMAVMLQCFRAGEEAALLEAREHAALALLAHNLTVAGALCAAFIEGFRQRQRAHDDGLKLYREYWRPGCGKAAP